MNERIEEFAEDCKILGEKEFAGKVVGFNYKKFAELLVKECASIAYRESCYSDPENVMGFDIAKKIEENFGVEE